MVDEVIAALVRQIQTQLVHIERVGPPAVQAFLESLRPKASATENLAAMPNESHPQAQCSIASGFFQFLGDGVCCLLDGLGCFGLIGHSRLRKRLGLPYQLAIIQRAWPLRCAPFGLRLRRRAHSFCSKPRFAPFPFRFSVELLLVATD